MSATARKRRGKAKEERPKKEAIGKEAEEEVRRVEKAVVKEAKKLEKAVEGRGERPRASPGKPSGRAPLATVETRHGTEMITRPGRGFSLGELSGGGLTPNLAARWGLRIDVRRRSVLDGNVSSLKAWHATGAVAKVEREAKEAEEALEKVGKEIKKEVVAVEKEAVKAEKVIKKEAKKAGKAIKEKTEKKPRPKKNP